MLWQKTYQAGQSAMLVVYVACFDVFARSFHRRFVIEGLLLRVCVGTLVCRIAEHLAEGQEYFPQCTFVCSHYSLLMPFFVHLQLDYILQRNEGMKLNQGYRTSHGTMRTAWQEFAFCKPHRPMGIAGA